MPLLNDLGLDTVTDADASEKTLTAPPIPPEGDHHAALAGYREINAASGSTGHELVFKVLAGPGKGKEVKEALWSPKGEDEAKDEKARARIRLFCHRLGLLDKVPSAADPKKHVYKPVEGKGDFPDVFGAECVIRVRHEEREYTANGKERKIVEAKLEYAGIFKLDDPAVKGVARATAAEVAAVAGTAQAAASGGFDDSDI